MVNCRSRYLEELEDPQASVRSVQPTERERDAGKAII